MKITDIERQTKEIMQINMISNMQYVLSVLASVMLVGLALILI